MSRRSGYPPNLRGGVRIPGGIKPSQASPNLESTFYNANAIDLYRQNARDLFARSKGIERYVIGIFGPDLIGSMAMAIDLNRQFYNTPNRVADLDDGAKVVRTRNPVTIPRSQRIEKWRRKTIQFLYKSNPEGGAFSYITYGPVITESSGTINRGDQVPIVGTIRDTSRRTRPSFQDQGEFEKFIPRLISGSRDVAWKRIDQLLTNTIGSGQRQSLQNFTYNHVSGPELRVLDSSVQTMLPLVRARAIAEMQKHVYGMLDRIHPNHRTYDLIYQIAELKDLRRTLSSTIQIWVSFERFVGSHVFETLHRASRNWRNPNLLRSYSRDLGRFTGFRFNELEDVDRQAASAFLSFKFGWESMLRAVQDFLPSPGRIARDVNLIVERMGEDSSFRTKRTWTDKETSNPTFVTSLLKDELALDSTIRVSGVRNVEMRLMANFNINFPRLDIPRLRRELIQRKLGATLSAVDVYNLIPWTWIADWFTGLGDYVSLMGTMANDRNIINYGFITYREDTEITAAMRGKLLTQVNRNINGVSSTVESFVPYQHNGKFMLSYQLRMSIPRVSSVKTYWDNSLNANQTAIVGALISTRSGFRPRRGV